MQFPKFKAPEGEIKKTVVLQGTARKQKQQNRLKKTLRTEQKEKRSQTHRGYFAL